MRARGKGNVGRRSGRSVTNASFPGTPPVVVVDAWQVSWLAGFCPCPAFPGHSSQWRYRTRARRLQLRGQLRLCVMRTGFPSSPATRIAGTTHQIWWLSTAACQPIVVVFASLSRESTRRGKSVLASLPKSCSLLNRLVLHVAISAEETNREFGQDGPRQGIQCRSRPRDCMRRVPTDDATCASREGR